MLARLAAEVQLAPAAGPRARSRPRCCWWCRWSAPALAVVGQRSAERRSRRDAVAVGRRASAQAEDASRGPTGSARPSSNAGRQAERLLGSATRTMAAPTRSWPCCSPSRRPAVRSPATQAALQQTVMRQRPRGTRSGPIGDARRADAVRRLRRRADGRRHDRCQRRRPHRRRRRARPRPSAEGVVAPRRPREHGRRAPVHDRRAGADRSTWRTTAASCSSTPTSTSPSSTSPTERADESAFRPPERPARRTPSTRWFVPSGDQYFVSTSTDRSRCGTGRGPAIDRPCRTPRWTSPARRRTAGWRSRGATSSNGEVAGPGVGFWDPATGAELGGTPLDLPPRARRQLVLVLQDQRYLAGAAPDALLVWDLTTGHLTAGSTGAATGLSAIAFDPQRPELLAIGGRPTGSSASTTWPLTGTCSRRSRRWGPDRRPRVQRRRHRARRHLRVGPHRGVASRCHRLARRPARRT